MGLINAVKKAWNVFNRDPTRYQYNTGPGYSFRPDRVRFSRGNERSIVRRYTTELHLMLQHLIFGTYYSTTKNDTKMKLTMD